ncbi:hypothetical protein EZV62_017640 [Acer yangbiense]|uniref:Xyloglucan endotransglucosylase/hydrolase n=1 Tax=Acer yangbiense TaxID=1000413 RepID=A0A5C7HH31_9ROSI|nr:hypothetical protein EZV62_017640 [Acer yangbiense]
MALFQGNLLLFLMIYLFFFMMILTPKLVSSHDRHYSPPSVSRLTDLFPHVLFDHGFSTFFGGSNIKLLNNASMATLSLDKSSGSGLVSKNKYHYGFFSAAIKLPAGLSSGVVLAFYVSGGQYTCEGVSKQRCVLVHLSIEANVDLHDDMGRIGLGDTRRKNNPTTQPSEPVSSCSKSSASLSSDPVDGPDFVTLSKQQSMAMDWARSKLMFYSYCKDDSRFKVLPPECK